ncbi:hypothetical protein BDK51DRAFT_38949 [Blyttiomyces helicus]|uniref:MYND-type domain-containing protein n=1 Tax=Blyttiomyces helicus TaxID=388810 RepID=A0A4P9WBM4_9FUNG|nr:hypothetical protein BDK51DRAFT_38949 [Blyttiomyces helicus]|eukprot:RKO88320.1 hypothetical protein BDK51DRAFT_38949 [Blyttiomyces helicus]
MQPPATSPSCVASSVEPFLHRASCGYAIATVMKRDGHLEAAVERYHRAIAIAESASEAERRSMVLFHGEEKSTGELLDELLGRVRIELTTTVERISTIPDESFRLAKMATACRAWESKDCFAQRSFCINIYTRIFRDGNAFISPPTAGDLAFMRGIFESDAEPVLHRVQCGFTLGYLHGRRGNRKASGDDYRRAIALAKSATAAERSATARLGAGKTAIVGDLLDGYLRVLRRALPVLAQRLTNAILERAFFVHGRSCDKCRTSYGTLKHCARCKRVKYCSPACQKDAWSQHRASCRPPGTLVVGDLVYVPRQAGEEGGMDRVLEMCSPAPGDRWRVGWIGGAEAETSETIVDTASVSQKSLTIDLRGGQTTPRACFVLSRHLCPQRAFFVHGRSCDKCETSSGTMKFCARCKRVNYCPSVCQKGAWPRHLPSCRPPSSFVVGDLVSIEMESVEEICTSRFSRVLEIRGPAPGNRWRVGWIGGADAETGDIIFDATFIRLVVPCNERDELVSLVCLLTPPPPPPRPCLPGPPTFCNNTSLLLLRSPFSPSTTAPSTASTE